ncbi:MAG TPA: hypothetical protein VHU41_16885, partial [Thermoanaerobaculia bacterium]|nr:hypothetical protein [Thermoanaerobaculia bacterium]
VYVANETGPSVTVYPPTAGGNVPPSRTISGSNTTLSDPESVTTDLVNNEMYVADFGGNAIDVFPLSANGNVAPTRSLIDGINSGIAQPRMAVVDPVHNEMFVASINSSIRIFSRTASGDAVPLRVISGSNTKISNPISISYNPSTDELFVDSYDVGGSQVPGILVFNRTDSGNVAPKRFISGSNTQFGNFTNYATLDVANGEIFAQGDNGLGIVVFNLTDSGNVAPKRNITGAATDITAMGGIVVDDANNRVLAANQNSLNYAVLAFDRTANGNALPVSNISGSSTGLATPFGLALDAAGGLTSNTPPSSIPALGWEALLTLAVMLSVLGFVAIRR